MTYIIFNEKNIYYCQVIKVCKLESSTYLVFDSRRDCVKWSLNKFVANSLQILYSIIEVIYVLCRIVSIITV